MVNKHKCFAFFCVWHTKEMIWIYNINKDYFKVIDTEKKAYWLGFLYADGCILENRNKNTGRLKAMVLELSLKIDDKYHVQKFLDDIESEAPIREKKIKLGDKTHCACSVSVCCTEMCRDLIKLGCTPRKSATITFPDNDILPESLKHHFIRGYFDGNGVAGIYYLKDYSRYNYRYGFAGSEDMMNSLMDFFEPHGFNKVALQDSGNGKQFTYSNKGRMKKFGEIIYKDATVSLKRKHDVFMRIAP